MSNKNGKLVVGAVGLAMLAVPCLSTAAETIDFGDGTLGLIGAEFTDGTTGLKAHGYYLDAGAWADASLFRRDEIGDRGFGVCNPNELIGGIECPDDGDINELDNLDGMEIISLELPAGYEWVSVQISSIDPNTYGTTEPQEPERGVLYADDGTFGTTPGAIGDTVIEEFTGIGFDENAEQVILINGVNRSAPFLVFEPYDHSNSGENPTNDYLVYQATIQEVVREDIDGRMTGGGSVFTDEPRFRVTHGFEIHCNKAEPNNIQVNWPGNKFHMTSLDNAICTEHEEIHQKPAREAPFDTFDGEGTGRLNGVDGATIDFVFVDGGEPGKRHDTADIVIRDAGGVVVLEVSGLLNNGNHQAHPNNK